MNAAIQLLRLAWIQLTRHRVRSLLTMTLMPLRVRNPSLPVVIGIWRITVPSCLTVIVCAAMSTVLTVALPTRKPTVRFSAPQTCLPACTPLRRTRRLTSVLPGQYFSGRQ